MIASRARLRVPVGFGAAVLAFLLARPSPTSLFLGLPLAVVGEGIRLWAAGHIEKSRSLATGGPYAHTQNPLYLGSMFLAGSVVVASASPWTALLVALYVGLFYPSAIVRERAFLAATFPDDYTRWASQVPVFFPRRRPAGPRTSVFAWGRVLRNREWRTILALPAVFALFWAKQATERKLTLRSRSPIVLSERRTAGRFPEPPWRELASRFPAGRRPVGYRLMTPLGGRERA